MGKINYISNNDSGNFKTNIFIVSLIYLATAVQGVPFFYYLNMNTYYIFALSVLLYLFAWQKAIIKYYKNYVFTILYLLVIYIGQLALFQAGNPLKFVRLIFTDIILGYILLNIFKKRFFKYYIDLMVGLAAISLILWSLAVIFPSVITFYRSIIARFGLDPSTKDHMIFISTRMGGNSLFMGVIRNAGAFSEPGSWGTYLMLAFVLNQYFESRWRLKSSILLITMLSTFSTATYVGIYLVLLGKYFKNKLNIKKLFIIILFSFMIIYSFVNFDFLQNKISVQLEDQLDKDLYEGTSGRFFGFRKSLNVLKSFPFTGIGLLYDTKITDLYSEFASGYGFGSIGSRIGIVGFFFWFLWIYKSTSYFSRRNKILTISNYLALLAVFFGQSIPITSAPVMAFLFSGWFFTNLDKRNNFKNRSVKGNFNKDK
ncbi:MAG: hypothetical protein JW866_10125 [Ignavibacteriales bacterium]|nr:hypothetical protein [Ignavibacteriales bacterium]